MSMSENDGFVPTAGFFMPQGPEDEGVRAMAARIAKLSNLAQAKLGHQLEALERWDNGTDEWYARKFHCAWLSDAEMEAISALRLSENTLREGVEEYLQRCAVFKREMEKLGNKIVPKVLVFPGEEGMPMDWMGIKAQRVKGKVKMMEVAANEEAAPAKVKRAK